MRLARTKRGLVLRCRSPAGADPIAQALPVTIRRLFPQLGDGRAHLLGEIVTPGGQRFDLQLKGSGRTPFSRGGDGKAAVGPMLREYLISEFMVAAGIPTTRSLAVVATGEEVWRETKLPGAVLARVAASHLRVGTFQFFAARATRPGSRRWRTMPFPGTTPSLHRRRTPTLPSSTP